MATEDADASFVFLVRSKQHRRAVEALLSWPPHTDVNAMPKTTVKQYDRLRLLHFLTSLHGQTHNQLLRHKNALKRLTDHWGSSLAASGAAGTPSNLPVGGTSAATILRHVLMVPEDKVNGPPMKKDLKMRSQKCTCMGIDVNGRTRTCALSNHDLNGAP